MENSDSDFIAASRKRLDVEWKAIAKSVALFKCIGEIFRLFDEVRCSDINAADANAGRAADVECVAGGRIVLAVEVKDGKLKLRHAQDKLPAAREKGIRELLFLVRRGMDREESDGISSLIAREFITGQNIYVCEFEEFLHSCLVLFGEGGRRKFLCAVGIELDSQRVGIEHRKDWAGLLGKV